MKLLNYLCFAVVILSLVKGDSTVQCPNGKVACPEGKWCCLVNDQYECCDTQIGIESFHTSTMNENFSMNNLSYVQNSILDECSWLTCNGICCSSTSCCPKTAICCPNGGCCASGQTCCSTGCCNGACCSSGCCIGNAQCCADNKHCCSGMCCGIGCCLGNNQCCPGSEHCCAPQSTCCNKGCCKQGKKCCDEGCCSIGTQCCGKYCCRSGAKCCGGKWCCKSSQNCGLKEGSCYGSGMTYTPATTTIFVMILVSMKIKFYFM